MIERKHEQPITCQVRLLGISRKTVYYLPRSASDADLSLMRRLDPWHLEPPSWAPGRCAVSFCAKVSTWAGTMCAHSCGAWPWRRWAPNRAPVSVIRATRSTRICCATWRSPGPTRSGARFELHPHGARVCVPRRRGGGGPPHGARPQGRHHIGVLPCERGD